MTPSSRSWRGVDGRRRARERVGAAGGLREGDRVADRVAAGQQRDDPVDAERDAAVRRRAVGERLQQEAEALLRLLGFDAERLEDLLLDVGPVDSDRAATQLPAVEDDVIGARAPAAGIAVEVAAGRGERVVQRVPASLRLVPLEHREVDDPEAVVAGGLALGDVRAQAAEHARGDLGAVGREEDHVAVLRLDRGGRRSRSRRRSGTSRSASASRRPRPRPRPSPSRPATSPSPRACRCGCGGSRRGHAARARRRRSRSRPRRP